MFVVSLPLDLHEALASSQGHKQWETDGQPRALFSHKVCRMRMYSATANTFQGKSDAEFDMQSVNYRLTSSYLMLTSPQHDMTKQGRKGRF